MRAWREKERDGQSEKQGQEQEAEAWLVPRLETQELLQLSHDCVSVAR